MKYLISLIMVLSSFYLYSQNEYLEAQTMRELNIKMYRDSIKNVHIDSLEKHKKALFSKTIPNSIYINLHQVVESYISSGFNIEFINTFKKRIKYITFNVQAYNAVDDKVDVLKSKRFVGPIEKNDIFTASTDDLWFNDYEIIEYIKIKSITLQFMDNTILKNVKYKTTTDDMKFNLINYKLYSELIY